ncbi:GH32 C-terminal domain-containing protein [Kaistia dalseonensis]|uniref:beta-fructofuranosidase n=1 Tax=Kaistia dalseonensis TaxID=410840 RepID=A0ABU0H4W6_9HYPH|nr:GH32 C-terminal domain-containing protein [Kaistia dalseonensis]MCX5494781.1 GH32 C-terminal domain-containing protein [Kaistia dalseonensis]MDQ0437362.1 beta-fructofuranosidase [Kaistia dalseonensis]
MTELKFPLAAGEVLHVFQKPVDKVSPSHVSLTGAAEADLFGPPSDDFTRTTYETSASGEATLCWDEASTVVSLAYAFDPARVRENGIRVLWTTEANRTGAARHKLHLKTPFGWMNDPNGLCEADGLTHLFYQHYPHSQRWNTMHWGHAVSRNGTDWVHQPVFLLPRNELLADDKNGGVFSGSAMPLPDGRLRVFYTDREDDRLPNWEWQMTAVSDDWIDVGPSTPVITAAPDLPGYRKDFRDPYVFRGPDGRWKMLLGGGDDAAALVLLYDTADPQGASNWEFVGVLHREPSQQKLPAECPCMVALDSEGAGLHVLIFGLLGSRDEITRRRNITLAIVGRFDGRTFEPIQREEMDFGTDCYAFQGIVGADGPYGIAWAANWTDVFKERDFPSAMTFPRRLVWRNGRLATPPIDAVATLRTVLASENLAEAASPVSLEDGLGEIELAWAEPGTPFKLAFRHPTHAIELGYDGSTLELHFKPPGSRPVPRYTIEDIKPETLRIFVDIGLIEIYVDDGRWCLTKRIESDEPVSAIELDTLGRPPAHARLWQLRPQRA